MSARWWLHSSLTCDVPSEITITSDGLMFFACQRWVFPQAYMWLQPLEMTHIWWVQSSWSIRGDPILDKFTLAPITSDWPLIDGLIYQSHHRLRSPMSYRGGNIPVGVRGEGELAPAGEWRRGPTNIQGAGAGMKYYPRVTWRSLGVYVIFVKVAHSKLIGPIGPFQVTHISIYLSIYLYLYKLDIFYELLYQPEKSSPRLTRSQHLDHIHHNV